MTNQVLPDEIKQDLANAVSYLRSWARLEAADWLEALLESPTAADAPSDDDIRAAFHSTYPSAAKGDRHMYVSGAIWMRSALAPTMANGLTQEETSASASVAGLSDEPRGTDAQILKERELTCSAVMGAIAFGAQGASYPPEDSAWLRPFYDIGKTHAELERKAANNECAACPGKISHCLACSELIEASRSIQIAPADEPTTEWEVTELAIPFCNMQPLCDLDWLGFAKAVLVRWGKKESVRVQAIELSDEQRRALTVKNEVSIPGASPTQIAGEPTARPDDDQLRKDA